MSAPERTAIASRRVITLHLDAIQRLVDQPGMSQDTVDTIRGHVTDLMTNVLRIHTSERLISAAPRTVLDPLFEDLTQQFRVGA